MKLFSRPRPKPSQNPLPDAPYQVGVAPQVGALMPEATANVQGGRFLTPYGAPTQLPGVYPGAQLRCGVEAIETRWSVLTEADVPYFQQTPRANRTTTTRDGGRPGDGFGPAGMVAAYGAVRQARAAQAGQFAAGLLGW